MLQKKSFQRKNKNNAGFSFIEVILGVFLISTGMIAVMSLMSTSLRESMDSRDQIIGVFLAQEGIELVRNLRDNNWAVGDDAFDDDDEFPAMSDPECSISTVSSGEIESTTPAYPVPNMTKFERKIQVNYDDNTEKNNATITSIVVWGEKVFPVDPVSQANCNTSNDCAFAEITLTRWGGS